MATEIDISNISNIPFFFIIGRPRSGTTLVQTILDAHPNVMIPGECPMILRLHLKYGHLKNLDEKNIETLITAIKQLPKIEYWPIDLEAVKQDLQKIKGPFNFRQIIKTIYLNFQSIYPKTEILTFGDKNPPYSKYPKLLLRIFPDAKFIHIVRDPRDHYLSVKKTDLLNALEPVALYLWKRSVIQVDKLTRRYPGKFITVKYENFVREPERFLKEICSFLAIPYQDKMLRFHEMKEASLQQYKEKNLDVYHGNLYSPIDASNINKWQKGLSDTEVMTADYIAGKTAAIAGYERKYRNIPFRLKAKLFNRLFIIKMYLYYLWLLKILPVGIRKKINRRTPELHTFYLKFFKS